MESMTIFTDMIGNYGFPIVACLYMMFSCNKTVNKNTEATQELITMFKMFIESQAKKNDKEGDDNA